MPRRMVGKSQKTPETQNKWEIIVHNAFTRRNKTEPKMTFSSEILFATARVFAQQQLDRGMWNIRKNILKSCWENRFVVVRAWKYLSRNFPAFLPNERKFYHVKSAKHELCNFLNNKCVEKYFLWFFLLSVMFFLATNERRKATNTLRSSLCKTLPRTKRKDNKLWYFYEIFEEEQSGGKFFHLNVFYLQRNNSGKKLQRQWGRKRKCVLL